MTTTAWVRQSAYVREMRRAKTFFNDLPAQPPDGTEFRWQVTVRGPLQLTSGDLDTLLVPGGPTRLIVPLSGEWLCLRYQRLPGQDGGVWYPVPPFGTTGGTK